MLIQLKGTEADIYRAWCRYYENRDGHTNAVTRTDAFRMARQGLWPTSSTKPLIGP